MLWLRKSKKGFTLIELMVVVAIIGVLALLGLRLYTGQQVKAKNAVIKANCGTIQTLIQAELADSTLAQVWDMVKPGVTTLLFYKSGIYNPLGSAQTNNTSASETTRATANATNAGYVYVYLDAAVASATYFMINGVTADGTSNMLYSTDLTARR